MEISYVWDNTGDPITAIPNNWPKCGKTVVAKPFHLTVMSQKIDFVIKGNEKVKFMLNWIYFFFIDFPQEPNPCQIRMFVKKSEHFSVSCCSCGHCMRNSQINSQRELDQIQVIQILLGGGLFPIKITCFDSCRMTYFLSLSLPRTDWDK